MSRLPSLRRPGELVRMWYRLLPLLVTSALALPSESDLQVTMYSVLRFKSQVDSSAPSWVNICGGNYLFSETTLSW